MAFAGGINGKFVFPFFRYRAISGPVENLYLVNAHAQIKGEDYVYSTYTRYPEGSIWAMLMIALRGLAGHISSEIHSRSKEIVFRKINGATVNNILRLLSKDVLLAVMPLR